MLSRSRGRRPLTASAVRGAAQATARSTTRRTCIRWGTRREIPLDNTVPGAGVFNSDLAFRGTWPSRAPTPASGLVDVSPLRNPKEIINWTSAPARRHDGQPGRRDHLGDLLGIAARGTRPAPASRLADCGDWPMAAGRGGRPHHRHQRPAEPGRDRVRRHAVRLAHRDARARPRERPAARLQQLVGQHDLRSPDPDEPSTCRGIDIIEVPLDDPAAASYLRFEKAGDEDAPSRSTIRAMTPA